MNVRSEFAGIRHDQQEGAAGAATSRAREVQRLREMGDMEGAFEEAAKDELPSGETRTVREIRLEFQRLTGQMLDIADRERGPISEEKRVSTEAKLATVRAEIARLEQRQNEARARVGLLTRLTGGTENDSHVRSFDGFIANEREAAASLERMLGPDAPDVVDPVSEAERLRHAALKEQLAAMKEKYPWLARDPYQA